MWKFFRPLSLCLILLCIALSSCQHGVHLSADQIADVGEGKVHLTTNYNGAKWLKCKQLVIWKSPTTMEAISITCTTEEGITYTIPIDTVQYVDWSK